MQQAGDGPEKAAASVTLVGTGNAFHTDGRGSQAILVDPGADRSDPPFLVDVGPTALGVMQRLGIEYARLGRLFVTHLHGDHIAGWPFLLLNLGLLEGRRSPFEVYGPSGTRVCLEGLSRLCYGDLLDPARLGFDVVYHELEVAEAGPLTAGELRFDVLPMEHHPSSIAYRFHLGGATLAVSGDTAWCPNLERLARESDVLLLECTTLGKQPPAHVSLDELRRSRDRLGNCRIVLVHLTDEVAADLAADPLGRVTAGFDGMTVQIP